MIGKYDIFGVLTILFTIALILFVFTMAERVADKVECERINELSGCAAEWDGRECRVEIQPGLWMIQKDVLTSLKHVQCSE